MAAELTVAGHIASVASANFNSHTKSEWHLQIIPCITRFHAASKMFSVL